MALTQPVFLAYCDSSSHYFIRCLSLSDDPPSQSYHQYCPAGFNFFHISFWSQSLVRNLKEKSSFENFFHHILTMISWTQKISKYQKIDFGLFIFALLSNLLWFWPYSFRKCDSVFNSSDCNSEEILLQSLCGLLRSFSAFSLFLRLIFNASMFSRASEITLSLLSIISDLFVVVLVLQVFHRTWALGISDLIGLLLIINFDACCWSLWIPYAIKSISLVIEGYSRSKIQKMVRLRRIKSKWSSQRPPAFATFEVNTIWKSTSNFTSWVLSFFSFLKH